MALTKVKLIADGVITSANLDASHGITTSDIGEGSNLYYTDARVSSYLSTNGFATQTDIVAAITDSAPVTLDTLNELAAALGDDPNFATTTATSLGLKAPLASPSFTGNVGIKNTVASTIDSASALGTLVVGDGSSVEGITIYTGTSNYGGLNFADATSGGGAYAGYIKFDHSDNSFGHYIGNAEKMGIDSSGNVSVGTDTPLYLYSEQGVAQVAANRVSSNGTIIDTSSSAAYINLYTPNTGSYITFHTANAINTSPSERMRIDSSGTIGINKSSGLNAGGFGSPKLVIKQDADSDWGGINIEASGNDSVFGISTTDSAHVLAGSYRVTAGYKDIVIKAGGTERLRVDNTQGHIGIAETGPAAPLHITKNAGASTTTEILRLDCGENNHQSGKGGKIVFRDINVYSDTATIEAVRVGASSASELKLTTRGTTRSIISRGGYTKMTNSGSTFSISGNYHEMNQNTASEWSYILHNSSSTPYGMYINYSGASPNNTQEIIYFQDTTQQRFYVTSAGAVYGNGTYGTISDQKLKENIVDATSKLDDINRLRVRNFNFKDKPEEKHIGFIAQEFEEVFPSMIETTQDKDDDNNPIEDSYTKTIKSSVLIPMLVKSIQELKADNDNLRERIQTLENQ